MKILVFGIHPDDIEICCGGTVALSVQQGHDVVLIDLSDGASASNGSLEEREKEAAAAAKILGVRERMNLALPDTGIEGENIEQARKVVASIRRERPDILLLPSKDDPHPDHAAGGVLLERSWYLAGVHGFDATQPAWRPKTVLVYAGRNEIEPHFVVDVTSMHDIKMDAIRAHSSQFSADKGRRPTPLNAPEFLPYVSARGRVYGRRIGVTYGEPFLALNAVAVSDLGIFQQAIP